MYFSRQVGRSLAKYMGRNSSHIPRSDPRRCSNMKSSVARRYFFLGAGLFGVTYYSYRSFSAGSPDDNFKLLLATLISGGIGYLGHRYIQVAHCDVEQDTYDKLDVALKKVQEKSDEIKADVKESIDKKAAELWDIIKEKYITEHLNEAFSIIDEIMNNLRDFGEFDTSEFKKPIIILLALVKKVQDRANQARLNNLPNESEIDSEQFELHKHFSNYALDIYDASFKSTKEAQAKKLGLKSPEDILFAVFDNLDDEHCPKYAILADHETKSIVFSVRGTHSLTDVVIDIVCDDEDFLDGHAHRGILRGMKKVLKDSMDPLKQALSSHPGYSLVLTGHSLGAGTVQLMAMEIMSNPKKYLPFSDTKVECVALAPPPVYRSVTPIPKAMKERLHIYINNQDCVPRMSLGSLAVLVVVLRAVDSLPYSNYEIFQILTNASDEEILEKVSKLEKAVKDIHQDRFPFLDHPGTINYLYRAEDMADKDSLSCDLNGYIVVREEGEWFSKQILLLERMVLDHLQMYYSEALDKAIVG